MVRKMQGIITKQSPWSRVNNLKRLIYEQAHQKVLRFHTSLIFGVSARTKIEENIYSSPINEFISVYISNFFLVMRLLKKKIAVQSYLAHAVWNISALRAIYGRHLLFRKSPQQQIAGDWKNMHTKYNYVFALLLLLSKQTVDHSWRKYTELSGPLFRSNFMFLELYRVRYIPTPTITTHTIC